MRLIPHTLVLLATACTALASTFSWVIDDGNALELKANTNETIVRFLLDPQPADPHFDILKSVGGENLVWVGPDDHPWHYGQWFSWKFINGVNFWETDIKTGKSEGITEVADSNIHIEGDSAEWHCFKR